MNRLLVGVGAILLVTGCSVSRRVRAPVLLPPGPEATLSQLVEIVNRRQAVGTLTAKVDLRFETREDELGGIERRFRAAQGRIVLARPERIRLQIEAPLLGTSIAEMASDGQQFQLLIYPPDYRALIEGRNDRPYRQEAQKLAEHPELKKAGPLAHIRPQHFIPAFLYQPILREDPDTFVFMHEDRAIEDDERPRAKKDQKVIRSYYVLFVARRGEPAPRRKIWFDRTRGLELVRQQYFDDKGVLLGDIRLSDYMTSQPDLPDRFAMSVRVERPYERYALAITVNPSTLSVNRDIPETAFFLSAPVEWRDSLRVIDLDKTLSP